MGNLPPLNPSSGALNTFGGKPTLLTGSASKNQSLFTWLGPHGASNPEAFKATQLFGINLSHSSSSVQTSDLLLSAAKKTIVSQGGGVKTATTVPIQKLKNLNILAVVPSGGNIKSAQSEEPVVLKGSVTYTEIRKGEGTFEDAIKLVEEKSKGNNGKSVSWADLMKIAHAAGREGRTLAHKTIIELAQQRQWGEGEVVPEDMRIPPELLKSIEKAGWKRVKITNSFKEAKSLNASGFNASIWVNEADKKALLFLEGTDGQPDDIPLLQDWLSKKISERVGAPPYAVLGSQDAEVNRGLTRGEYQALLSDGKKYFDTFMEIYSEEGWDQLMLAESQSSALAEALLNTEKGKDIDLAIISNGVHLNEKLARSVEQQDVWNNTNQTNRLIGGKVDLSDSSRYSNTVFFQGKKDPLFLSLFGPGYRLSGGQPNEIPEGAQNRVYYDKANTITGDVTNHPYQALFPAGTGLSGKGEGWLDGIEPVNNANIVTCPQ